MRKFLAVVLLAAIGFAGYRYKDMPAAMFELKARSATGAIFIGPERKFNCSGTEIGHTAEGDGVFLTARHCVADVDTNKINEDMKISFSGNQGGPFYDTVPIAISSTDDLALLLVRNGGSLPEVRIRDERKLSGGDPIFNVSFPLSSGKLVFHGEYMEDRFPSFPGMLADYKVWDFAMPVNLTFAHGSSGSGIFSAKQQALIGVAVGTFEEGSYNIAIPADRVLDFLLDIKDNTVDKFIKNNPEKDESDFI